MQNFYNVGRDIIYGKGFGAKHWAGAIIFSKDAIYVCPRASHAAVMIGFDSGAAAAGMFGAIGGAIAGTAAKKNDSASWQANVHDISELPKSVTGDPDWPLGVKKRPAIVLHRDAVEKIERRGSRVIVSAHGEVFKLGLKLFGRGKAVAAIQNFGWAI
jgi:hypothetical protein